jgi:hypothetical protein
MKTGVSAFGCYNRVTASDSAQTQKTLKAAAPWLVRAWHGPERRASGHPDLGGAQFQQSVEKNLSNRSILRVSVLALAVSTALGGNVVKADSYPISLHSGLNLIANQLDRGSNTLNEVFAKVPDGCVMSKYNNGSGTWSNSYFSGGSWMPGTLTLSPGEGAWFQSPTNFTLTVTGTPHVPVLPVSISPGHLYLLSRQTNDIGTWDNIVGTIPEDSTLAYTYNGGFTAYQYSSDDGQWNPIAPSVPVGSALWIRTPGGAGNLYPPPVITQQPQSQTNVFGSNVTFSVTATGVSPLSYQWRFNITNILSGATNATYTVFNAQAYDAGAYDVVVSNSGGPVTSAVAALTMKGIIHTYAKLTCANGSPLAGCSVTLDYYDSTGLLGSSGPVVTDSNGGIDYAGGFGGCANSSQINEHFIVSASCCPDQTWTIYTSCCCGDLGTLVCNNCATAAPCGPGKVIWLETGAFFATDILSSDLNGQSLPFNEYHITSNADGEDIAVDSHTGAIYWGDNSTVPGKVMWKDAAGNLHTGPTTGSGEAVLDIAVDGQGNVYWDDWLSGNIYKYNIAAGGPLPSPIVLNFSHLYGFVIDQVNSKLYYFDNYTIYRTDLSGNPDSSYSIGPVLGTDFLISGIALDTCSDKIYVIGKTDPQKPAPNTPYICYADLNDGTGLTPILSGGVAVGDWGPNRKVWIFREFSGWVCAKRERAFRVKTLGRA